MRAIIPLIVAAVLTTAFSAPRDDQPKPAGKSFQHDDTVGVQLENSQIRLTGDVRSGKSDGYRIRRPCWYEPGPDANSELQKHERTQPWMERIVDQPWDEYIKFFKDKVGQDGRWWVSAFNSRDPSGTACYESQPVLVWVPNGTTPRNGITLEQLYQIARAALTVPTPTINLSPDAKSYVNLPTYVWLTGIGRPTRSVTASIPGVMTATVTARLSTIEIDPGTTSAEIRDDCGPTGRRYTKGAPFTCGVRYGRASVDQPGGAYTLTVTTVWQVDGGAFTFQPVRTTATRTVPVGEVQTTVRTFS